MTLADLRCVTREQLEGWIDMYRRYAARDDMKPVDRFCDDCTAEYRAEMLKEGRCIRG